MLRETGAKTPPKTSAKMPLKTVIIALFPPPLALRDAVKIDTFYRRGL